MKNRDIFIFMSGLFLVLTGAATVAGWLLDMSWLMDWNGKQRMALNTAIAFQLVGASLIIISGRIQLDKR